MTTETKKSPLRYALVVMIPAAIWLMVYLPAAFYEFNLNARFWSCESRSFVAVFGGIFGFISLLLTIVYFFIESEEEAPDNNNNNQNQKP